MRRAWRERAKERERSQPRRQGGCSLEQDACFFRECSGPLPRDTANRLPNATKLLENCRTRPPPCKIPRYPVRYPRSPRHISRRSLGSSVTPLQCKRRALIDVGGASDVHLDSGICPMGPSSPSCAAHRSPSVIITSESQPIHGVSSNSQRPRTNKSSHSYQSLSIASRSWL